VTSLSIERLSSFIHSSLTHGTNRAVLSHVSGCARKTLELRNFHVVFEIDYLTLLNESAMILSAFEKRLRASFVYHSMQTNPAVVMLQCK